MLHISIPESDQQADARLSVPSVMPQPFHVDMPPLLQAALMRKPVEPKPTPLTAYQHFVAMLGELKDADIETLLSAETEFFNFTKPDIGDSQTWAQDIAKLCNDLIEKRYSDHYEGSQHDPFVAKWGVYRKREAE